MNNPLNPPSPSSSPRHPEFSLERISRLVTELEQELANAPADIPNGQQLREEITTLKQVLASSNQEESPRIEERLHAIRGGLEDMTARVEGEVLRDGYYIAEIGRILGLV